MRESPGDTIAAISTAAGRGAIAVVRVSGGNALEIADAVFEGVSLPDCVSHTVHYGRVVDADGRAVDEVLATVLRAPHTYTTEDMVEFGCHGGAVPAGRVLSVLIEAGAREARRGEFTERAFLAGRLDLVQAEAVADVVAAQTRRGLELALGQLEGSLSTELTALRSALVDFRAEVETLIDFPDDEVSGGTRDEILALGRSVAGHVSRLLERCDLGVAVRDGVTVAIVGRPNVGKSSIMNALLERDRSIVTPLPGTTRDAVEDLLHVDGVLLRLVDTAGWRDGGDAAERAGVGRAVEAARGADLAVFVVDGSEPLGREDEAVASALTPRRTVVAVNKEDLGCVVGREALAGILAGGTPLAVTRVSALEGSGLRELRESLRSAAAGSDSAEPPLVTNLRHVRALERCGTSVQAALERLAGAGDPSLAAVDLQDAAEALGDVTGATTAEDVLERIFARFCVGK
ncbi:MAG: tRNA uridine-5-carboxymethylaminomethyl(34) synthesis GTPase MnmE [Candidatus Eisenbacteria bacterium]